MVGTHTLLLLRHAQAVDFAPGLEDHDRPLTERGIEQAASVGDAMRAHKVRVDHVICSSALRTRQTWSALGMDAEVNFTKDAYNAGSDSVLGLIQELEEDIGSVLVIGHGPGLPTLAAQLAGPGSGQRALDVVKSRYPVGTISEFQIDGPWADLQVGRLVWLRLGQ